MCIHLQKEISHFHEAGTVFHLIPMLVGQTLLLVDFLIDDLITATGSD